MAERPLGTDQQTLTALFHTNSSRINGLLIARSGDRALAEELTAQTFEAAAVQFARDRGEEVTPAWLTTVALRRLVDHWRHLGRTSKVLERAARLQPSTYAPHAGLDDDVRRALDSLPFNQRAAVTLRYLDEWSVAEIAEGLGMTYRAAESLLARGRRSLRAALEAEGVEL